MRGNADFLRLTVVRHAKSSWKDVSCADVDRPLKPSGVNDAYEMGRLLSGKIKKPGLILSSPATRAIHTALIFARNLEFPCHSIQIRQDIYGLCSDDLMEFISILPEDEKDVMFFGHNPLVTEAVNMLTGSNIGNLPTTGVAVIDFGCGEWEAIRPGAGRLMFQCSPANADD